MLKHIRPKDVVEFLLIGLAVTVLIIVAGILESAPLGIALWLAVALAVILWVTWFIIVGIQRNNDSRRPKLKILRNGQWVDVEHVSDLSTPRRPVQLFDQDNPNDKDAA